MSNYTIYTIGDIDFVYTAFNGIALIFSSHGSNEWLRFAAYAAAIGLFYKSMKWVLAPHKKRCPDLLLDHGAIVLFHRGH